MSHLEDALDELDYPIARDEGSAHFDETTLLLADGEANLGELIAKVPAETFSSRADLEADLHAVLPRSAVGEPYQSEGEG